ncbi:hypothetical protein FMEAI12_6500072 [Parafrankia sp. Ea1.12]|nr:hypothetical protein FMEAI12_6500072 [Parafrankia sp. Ea1.12]
MAVLPVIADCRSGIDPFRHVLAAGGSWQARHADPALQRRITEHRRGEEQEVQLPPAENEAAEGAPQRQHLDLQEIRRVGGQNHHDMVQRLTRVFDHDDVAGLDVVRGGGIRAVDLLHAACRQQVVHGGVGVHGSVRVGQLGDRDQTGFCRGYQYRLPAVDGRVVADGIRQWRRAVDPCVEGHTAAFSPGVRAAPGLHPCPQGRPPRSRRCSCGHCRDRRGGRSRVGDGQGGFLITDLDPDDAGRDTRMGVDRRDRRVDEVRGRPGGIPRQKLRQKHVRVLTVLDLLAGHPGRNEPADRLTIIENDLNVVSYDCHARPFGHQGMNAVHDFTPIVGEGAIRRPSPPSPIWDSLRNESATQVHLGKQMSILTGITYLADGDREDQGPHSADSAPATGPPPTTQHRHNSHMT